MELAMIDVKKQSPRRTISRIKSNGYELLSYLQQRCLYQWRTIRLKKHSWSSIDRKLVDSFLNASIEEHKRYSDLFLYLVSGMLYYSASDHAHVYYPGASSVHRAEIDAMEGFCRILPMICAWIRSGRPSIVEDFTGREVDLIQVTKTGLLAGTNPKSKGYWGAVGDRDQRIVEAADVALSIWLLREHLWPKLSSDEREMILNWLSLVDGKETFDNNWHLFPVIVSEVLASFGYSCDRSLSNQHYSRFKSFYLGNGWFSDGPNGVIDYYNAWGIHYALFWIDLINPKLDHDFIESSINDFAKNYKYFFSTDGIPMIGRSVCYRMATPAPLIAAAIKKSENVSPGLARRALDCVWKYFIEKGALHRGTITQGYWRKNLALLDNYSGPGSSLWSCRSLVLAFYNPPESDFWMAPLERLPIEEEDYDLYIPEIGWRITGHKNTREVQMTKLSNAEVSSKAIGKLSYLNWFLVFVLGLPYRSEKRFPRYEARTYSSLHPFV
jgi:hypothetical protein